MKQIKSLTAIMLSLVVILASCNTDDEVTPAFPAPELPPLESMTMDFSNFTDDNSGGRMQSNDNWGHAALQVGFWNLALTIQLAVPVSAFGVAINQDPSYDSNREVWVWTFDHTVGNNNYTAELTADLAASGIEWKMYISKEGGFQNVLWYTGFTAESGQSGYWILNKDGNNPVSYLRIDWEKENNEVGQITYTHIEEGADGQGNYIEFEKSTSGEFNRSYDIFINQNENLIEIDWNSDTRDGRIRNPKHYGDNEFRCWDTNLEDTLC